MHHLARKWPFLLQVSQKSSGDSCKTGLHYHELLSRVSELLMMRVSRTTVTEIVQSPTCALSGAHTLQFRACKHCTSSERANIVPVRTEHANIVPVQSVQTSYQFRACKHRTSSERANIVPVQSVQSSYQFVLLILQCQQWLFHRPPDVGVGSSTLEVGGSKLWELVVREVLLGLQCREGETCGGRGVCVCVCV